MFQVVKLHETTVPCRKRCSRTMAAAEKKHIWCRHVVLVCCSTWKCNINKIMAWYNKFSETALTTMHLKCLLAQTHCARNMMCPYPPPESMEARSFVKPTSCLMNLGDQKFVVKLIATCPPNAFHGPRNVSLGEPNQWKVGLCYSSVFCCGAWSVLFVFCELQWFWCTYHHLSALNQRSQASQALNGRKAKALPPDRLAAQFCSSHKYFGPVIVFDCLYIYML